METQMDLFELLQMMTGAPQISDLPHAPYQKRAVAIMGYIPLEGYSLREILDMLQYLFGEKVEVQNTQEARKWLREQVRQQWRLSRSAQEHGATTYTGQRENAETAE